MPAEKVGKFIELPKSLVAEIQKMCEEYGTTFTFEVVDGLNRHVANPPQRKPEPLPPVVREAPAMAPKKPKPARKPKGKKP